MRYWLLLAVLCGTALTVRADEAKPVLPNNANHLIGWWYTDEPGTVVLFVMTKSEVALTVGLLDALEPPPLSSGYRLVEHDKKRYLEILNAKAATASRIPLRIGYKVMGDRLALSFSEGRLKGTWTFKRYSSKPPAEKAKDGEKAKKAANDNKLPL